MLNFEITRQTDQHKRVRYVARATEVNLAGLMIKWEVDMQFHTKNRDGNYSCTCSYDIIYRDSDNHESEYLEVSGFVYEPFLGYVDKLNWDVNGVCKAPTGATLSLESCIKRAFEAHQDQIDEAAAMEWLEYPASSMRSFPESESEDTCTVETYRDGFGYHVREGHRTDEGSESTHATVHRPEGGIWRLERTRHATDCDGPLDRYWEGTIHNGKVEEISHHQRDHFAEQAGY